MQCTVPSMPQSLQIEGSDNLTALHSHISVYELTQTGNATYVCVILMCPNCPFASFLLSPFVRGIAYFDAMRFSLSLLLVSLTSICSAQLKTCYDIDGDPSSQIPCDPSANVSACCAPGGVCVTNFYCHGLKVGDTHDRVGTCTDRTGNDPACPLPLLRSITPSFPFFVICRLRTRFAYCTATQNLARGIGLATRTILPTAATELSA